MPAINWISLLSPGCRVVSRAEAGLAGGLPAYRPGIGRRHDRLRVARSPALVRSAISAREMRTGGLVLFDDGEEVADRAKRSRRTTTRVSRTGSRAAGEPAPAGSGLRRRCSSRTRGAALQRAVVELWIGALVFGRNLRVANQTPDGGGFHQFCRHEFGSLGTGFTNQNVRKSPAGGAVSDQATLQQAARPQKTKPANAARIGARHGYRRAC